MQFKSKHQLFTIKKDTYAQDSSKLFYIIIHDLLNQFVEFHEIW
jgi:hypothetical protein